MNDGSRLRHFIVLGLHQPQNESTAPIYLLRDIRIPWWIRILGGNFLYMYNIYVLPFSPCWILCRQSPSQTKRCLTVARWLHNVPPGQALGLSIWCLKHWLRILGLTSCLSRTLENSASQSPRSFKDSGNIFAEVEAAPICSSMGFHFLAEDLQEQMYALSISCVCLQFTPMQNPFHA